MGVLKKRPRIKLRAPALIRAGDEVVLTVEVEADKPVPARSLQVWLEGEERAVVGGGESQRTWEHAIVRLQAAPAAPRVLAGVRHFRVAVRIPPGAPPSYRGDNLVVEYLAGVDVDIPWWPDAKARFELAVSLPARGDDEGRPLRFWTREGGPAAREGYFEGSADRDAVAPGDVLSGAVALANTRWNRYRVVHVSLVALETVTPGRRQPIAGARHAWSVTLPARDWQDGASVPFRLRVPDVVPTFRGVVGRVDWFLEVRAAVRLGADVVAMVPIVVLPPRARGAESPRPVAAPPPVGDGLRDEVWQGVARETGLVYEDERLRGRVPGGEISVRVEQRKRGATLVGRVEVAPLGLDLEVSPGGRLLGRGAVRSGADGWDRRHDVRAREAAQAETFLGKLLHVAPALAGLAVRAGDTFIEIERGHAGRSAARLRAFVEELRHVAHAVAEARAVVPPPAAMRHVVPAWRALAERLGGTLDHACMAVRAPAALRGVPASVETVWNGAEPVATELELRPPAGLALEQPAYVLWDERGARTGSPWPPVAEALLPALSPSARSLDADRTGVRLVLSGTPVDADAIWLRLERLHDLCATLRGRAGVFR
jgi:hypothetical protein